MPTRRKDSHGTLDSGRPNPGSANIKNKFCVYSAATGRFHRPMFWGKEEHVIERFTNEGVAKENISFVKTFTFDASGIPAEFFHIFKNYYGPTMNAFEAADENGKARELQQELEVSFDSQNKSTDRNTTSRPATYVRVTVYVEEYPDLNCNNRK